MQKYRFLCLLKKIAPTLVLDTFYVKYCSILVQCQKIYLNFRTVFLTKYKTLHYYILFLWDFIRPKMCAYVFFVQYTRLCVGMCVWVGVAISPYVAYHSQRAYYPSPRSSAEINVIVLKILNQKHFYFQVQSYYFSYILNY